MRLRVQLASNAKRFAQHRMIGSEVIDLPVKHFSIEQRDRLVRRSKQRLMEAPMILDDFNGNESDERKSTSSNDEIPHQSTLAAKETRDHAIERWRSKVRAAISCALRRTEGNEPATRVGS